MKRPALDRLVLVLVLAASGALLLPIAAAAQGTPADYARAQQLRATCERLAVDIAGPATAIGDTHRFWYRKTVRGAEQLVVVEADTQQRQPAFNHDDPAAPYGDHKRFDFFVQHLLGVTPPHWNRTSTAPTDHAPQR
jgi:hypothetical protein